MGHPLPARMSRSRRGSCRNAASIRSRAPSATDGALAPGMLATATPCSTAASSAMVLTPAPNLWMSRSRSPLATSSADSGRNTCHNTSAPGSSA
ncbi:Uncharacterised protein [Mycobacteroides abscessus subsp. abscessus]|nr:Uncharacterised protein [Mycobacteroides abscessus subsp. abscessus]